MESFEQVAKVFFEARGYVVTSNVKFPVRKQTRKAAYAEFQEHGYELTWWAPVPARWCSPR